jgi:glycolate oxidase FAD binding subunit
MTDIVATSEADVVEAVRAARDWKSPLNIVGARTKRNLGRAVASWGTVLDLSGLRGIVSYEPEELIVTVKPGTPVSELTEVLAAKNQRLGFDPADWGPLLGAKACAATIGGVIAADTCGSAAVRYGRVRDHLLGFRAVNGWGEAYKAGGKVVKNVTGFDLPKLMCGAFGTLGPLTEVTLRVFPKAPESAVYAVTRTSEEQGLALLRRAWSSPLEATGLAYLSHAAGYYFPEIDTPDREDTGGDTEDDGDDDLSDKRIAVFRVEGTRAALAEKKAMLSSLTGPHPLQEVADGDAVFKRIDSATAFVNTLEDVWLLHVPPATMTEVASRANGIWIADWAGGRLWIRGTPGYAGTWLREATARLGGNAVLVRASEQTRIRVAPFEPERPERAALTRAVKAAFDPLGLFNPGRMYEGI